MLTFEKLTFENIDTIVSMMQDFYAIDGYDMDPAVSRENFKTFLDDQNLGQSWLIKENDLVLGYIIVVYFFSFEFKGRVALLDELFLNADARGKGVGRKAVEFVKDYVQEQGCKLVLLEVESHNLPAQKLYESQGFDFHPRNIMRYSIKNN
ncbi:MULTISPECIES: GNAT family N-acetyltransferase [Sphingobacterium]|jgi:ribosomal protein S18 acetylase RimI-like enzyme|uniref:GNAT family N-acetyltransferase n=1 Tax=Sphingobacterium TaxID=28453 RepID=UPI0004E6004D|nr:MULTISPECIES: GNAT family N-acetyltransferase [Sphingobacterium]CDS95088.1 N-acetyltransferase GCN5 [Sphingobacterium sp. PM2-P1-29]SJN28154.1 Histone acetyltransferase HPA2 and related acetyltransferases [Sphingobacterium faecium PCAi_F2.5]HCU44666.1 N-acetyltransferase [Sphingobacterium sp.]UPZ37706.1 GNAT family N-acetyltransferase [Sphingobacterium sp. PCS056]UXD69208.1 GNAT family N-acetyltransferase [Sphingobacterium faecium]